MHCPRCESDEVVPRTTHWHCLNCDCRFINLLPLPGNLTEEDLEYGDRKFDIAREEGYLE